MAAVLGGIFLASVALIRIPLPPAALILGYSENLHYWFGVGGTNDFTTANPWRFELVNLQVVLYPLVHSISVANSLAWGLFAIGFIFWLSLVIRPPYAPEPLALSSLLALGMLPVYHRSYDTAVLLLALCSMLGTGKHLTFASRAILFSLLPLAIPAGLFVNAIALHLPPSVISSWWWNTGVESHLVWPILLLTISLFCALVQAKSGETARGLHPKPTRRDVIRTRDFCEGH